MTMLTLDSVLTFGKHKGKTISQVTVVDPTYLVWCLDNLDGFELDAEADERLDLELDYYVEAHDGSYGV